MSAIMKCTDCFWAMGTPNCWRVLAHWMLPSRQACDPPRQPAPRLTRPMSNVFMKVMKPAPNWPSTFSLGTRQSSKISSAVLLPRMPILFSEVPTVKPGNSFSTMKAVTPPRAPSDGSVTAMTLMMSAWAPLVIKVLVPLRT